MTRRSIARLSLLLVLAAPALAVAQAPPPPTNIWYISVDANLYVEKGAVYPAASHLFHAGSVCSFPPCNPTAITLTINSTPVGVRACFNTPSSPTAPCTLTKTNATIGQTYPLHVEVTPDAPLTSSGKIRVTGTQMVDGVAKNGSGEAPVRVIAPVHTFATTLEVFPSKYVQTTINVDRASIIGSHEIDYHIAGFPPEVHPVFAFVNPAPTKVTMGFHVDPDADVGTIPLTLEAYDEVLGVTFFYPFTLEIKDPFVIDGFSPSVINLVPGGSGETTAVLEPSPGWTDDVHLGNVAPLFFLGDDGDGVSASIIQPDRVHASAEYGIPFGPRNFYVSAVSDGVMRVVPLIIKVRRFILRFDNLTSLRRMTVQTDVTVTRSLGYFGEVTFGLDVPVSAVNGLPLFSFSFTPTSAFVSSTTLRVTPAFFTPQGTYTLTIRGTINGSTESFPLTVTVI